MEFIKNQQVAYDNAVSENIRGGLIATAAYWIWGKDATFKAAQFDNLLTAYSAFKAGKKCRY
ncbi:hypothetical protein [Emticicia sp. 17c]|uniref:hypothetical protein n=1 Tax=Emticicia sp. 17c TaxID=3127704 RepID=UPI00301D56C9